MAERILCVLGKISSGGVESIVFSYYTALDKSLFQYDMVYEDASERPVPARLIEMGARSFEIPSMNHPVKYVSALRKIIKENKYRIIHCNTNTLSFLPLFAALTCGVKIRILHNHSTSSRLEKKRNLVKIILRPVSRALSNKWCACSCRAGRWMYGDKAFEKGKVAVFNNGVPCEKFAYNTDFRCEIRKELNIENKTVIGHIGRFVSVKNHRFLIDIFEEYRKVNKNSVLVLVGEGEESDNIREYVKNKSLEDHVIFAGVRWDAYKFFSAFDIFLLPSLYEGLPVVSVEASSAGLPQILSDRVTEEAKLNESVKFLPIDSAKIWVDNIDSMLTCDREKLSSSVTDGEFNIKNCVKVLENYYRECLEEL